MTTVPARLLRRPLAALSRAEVTEALPEGEEPAELPVARRRTSMGVMVAIVVLVSLGAAIGMSSIAGFGAVLHRLAHVHGAWIAASAGGVVVAFLGYRTAFDRIVFGPDGAGLTHGQRLGVVAAGFGAFVHRGGSAIDRFVLRATGHEKRDSDVRLASLQVLEVVPVALGATAAAYLALFVGGRGRPPIGYDLPWAVGPVVATPLVVWAVRRYAGRWTEASGWRYWLGVVLDGARTVQSCLLCDRGRRLAFAGMTVFVAGELFAVWSSMAAFGFRMSAAGVVLGYGLGYVMSRRSAPLGGAGLIDVMLIVALTNAGAPLAVAVVGTFTYRFFNLWCTMPASLGALVSLRRLVAVRRPGAVRRPDAVHP